MGLPMRNFSMVCLLAVLVASCAEGQPPLTAYVEDFNRSAQETYVPLRAAWAEYSEIAAPTPADLSVVLRRDIDLRRQAQMAFDAIVPPHQITRLHELFVSWHRRFVQDEEALLGRVTAALSWGEIEDSVEFLRYETTLALGAVACREFRAALTATEVRGVFAEAEWLPGDMREVVDVALGCDVLVDAFAGGPRA